MNGLGRTEYRESASALLAPGTALPGGATSQASHEIARLRFGIGGVLRRELALTRAAFGIFEWVALTYLGTSSVLILCFAENFAQKLRLLGTQGFVALLILALCRKQAGGSQLQTRSKASEGLDPSFSQQFWHFWRHWYPHLFFLFCFEEMSKLVHLVQPEWQDSKLIAFDQWLTGVIPSLWLERFAHPALTEFMEFAYFTYFLFLLVLAAILYYRREWAAYWAVMTYSVVGYALGYVIAIVFPAQSPWFTLAGMWHADLVGGPFTALINFIEKCGRVHGAAFPSQHVAGATAALLGAWRHRRWLFWVFLPLVVCMDISTVYVRNHYVADVLAGTVTGTLGYLIGLWLIHRSKPFEDRARQFGS
jgi:membrane-associated phospholipid phosphatase